MRNGKRRYCALCGSYRYKKYLFYSWVQTWSLDTGWSWEHNWSCMAVNLCEKKAREHYRQILRNYAKKYGLQLKLFPTEKIKVEDKK